MQKKHWKILSKNINENPNVDDIVRVLLKNRKIKKKDESEFFNPTHPEKISIDQVGISKSELKKAIKRIEIARKNKEIVVVFGDYDADGVTATAILWEALYETKVKAMPFIPDRFKNGYGIKPETVREVYEKYPDLKLIITVDNGIVANKAISTANKLGVDVIITDHHQSSKKKPKAFAIVHTTEICGSAVSWFLAREWLKKNKKKNPDIDLVALGTVADQMRLLGVNRSFVRHGLDVLRNTKRKGLLALYEQAALTPEKIDTYEINFVIAPRINAAGRLTHAMEALRLLCTRDWLKAVKLAQKLSKINSDRQSIVKNVLFSDNTTSIDQSDKIIIITGDEYHEGVIGIAASKLVDRYYRPVIVGSVSEGIVKASARSIEGFNIIEAIREFQEFLIEAGGHPMAAGFSLEISNLDKFSNAIKNYANEKIEDELLTKTLTIDCELDFNLINYNFVDKLNIFNPIGNGNPEPLFVSNSVQLIESKIVGQDKRHLKLKVRQNGIELDAIAFGFGYLYKDITKPNNFSIAYSIEENIWNGNKSLQLKIKDINM